MTLALKTYRALSQRSEKLLQKLLQKRLEQGKEDPARLWERMGIAKTPRPEGPLIWLHAASVGEAQSALILIDHLLLTAPEAHILLTTGTRTSADSVGQKLPARCIHQYIPLDHPLWVARFMDHWQPNLALWMESELWPNLIIELSAREIPAALVNARLSPQSYKRWKWFPGSAEAILSAFSAVLTQTAADMTRYRDLGANNVTVTDNLKYSARALPADETAFKTLAAQTAGRRTWVYASTHAGEEVMAGRLHGILKNNWPELLTILVPRHPARGAEIEASLKAEGLKTHRRSEGGTESIDPATDIYIADTMGELGLFYRLAPIACIGRTFSLDGGGGHNPLEAAQLGCAVLHGPKVQNLADLFEDMHKADAAITLTDEHHFLTVLQDLLEKPEVLAHMRKKARDFSATKTGVVNRVMDALAPLLTPLK